MTISVSHLRVRVFIVILTMFVVWQAFKLIPWFLAMQQVGGSLIQESEGRVAPVLVTVYYEALCPDSKSFIMKQLLPSFEKASRLISVDLVPYGKAKTEEDQYGNISFSCQHGPVECQANKIHACAIHYISDMRQLTKYITCMISNNINPEHIAEECGVRLAVDVEPILKCSKTRKGTELLKDYGVRTSQLSSSISFVPTILLNHEHRKQTAILKNLFREVCNMYAKPPIECLNQSHHSVYR